MPIDYTGPLVEAIVPGGIIFVTGTKSASGDNVLIASPGLGQQIVIVALNIQNEAATANTLILKAGASAFYRFLGQTQGAGLSLVLPVNRQWRLGVDANGNGNALQINLSAATAVGYSIAFYYAPTGQ